MMNEFDLSALIHASGNGTECSAIVIQAGQRPELWNQFLSLRYLSFGRWEGSDSALGIETDDQDQFSVFVLVIWEGVVIAGCRLIDGEQTRISLDPLVVASGRHFEISRLLIRSEVKDRGTRERVMFALLQRVVEYAFKERGYDDFYCDTRLPFFIGLKRIFGESLEQLGAQHDVEKSGETLALVPMRVNRFRVAEMRRRFVARLQPEAAAIAQAA